MKHQLMIILHPRKVVKVMSNATFTLLGIYQYGQRIGDDFFEKLTFPAGIDKSVVVNNLLLECADYEVLYPDYDFMKSLVEIFSKKYERTFTKWLAVQSIDYEPLDNYDRKEAWSDSTSESSSEHNSLSTSESEHRSDSTSTSTSDETSDSTANSNNISAFNASTLQPDTSASLQAATAGKSKHDGHSAGDNQSLLASQDQKDALLSRMFEHRGRVHGNIGVKTTQSIYLEEWELDKLNIYDEIMVLFAREFLIPFTY